MNKFFFKKHKFFFILIIFLSSQIYSDTKADKVAQQFASINNTTELITFLSKQKKAAKSKTKNGETFLLWAIKNNKEVETIKILLDNGFKVENKNAQDQDAIFYLCMYQKTHIESAKLILSRYGNKKNITQALLRKDKNKLTPLDYLLEYNNIFAYKALLTVIDEEFIIEYKMQAQEQQNKQFMEFPDNIKIEEEIPETKNDTISSQTETEEENSQIITEDAKIETVETIEEIPEVKEEIPEVQEEIPPSENINIKPNQKISLYDYEKLEDSFFSNEEIKTTIDLAKIKNPNKADKNGRTLLMTAAKNGNDWEVRSLLASGANINETDYEGWTALMYAIRYQNNIELINLLLKNGAEINIKNRYGKTALELSAVYSSNPEITKAIVSHSNIAQSDLFKAFILSIKANNSSAISQEAKIKVFLDKNVPINRFYEGKTPLMYACEYGFSTNALKLLLDCGASITIRDANGKTAFDYAMQNTRLEHDDIFWSLNSH